MKNESILKLRFKGFHNKWIRTSIKQLATIRNGGAFKSKDFVNKGIPIVKIANILNNRNVGGKFKYYKPNKQLKKYELSKNDILIAMSGATAGKIAIIHSNNIYYQNQRVGHFVTNNHVNNYFLYILLQSDKFFENLNRIKTSGAQPNISSKDINLFQFLVPNFSEQIVIGKFFATLDNLIQLQQKKVALLKKIKKAYLQKIFPHKNRFEKMTKQLVLTNKGSNNNEK